MDIYASKSVYIKDRDRQGAICHNAWANCKYIYIYIIVPVLNSAMCDLKLHGEELSVCTPEKSLYSF